MPDIDPVATVRNSDGDIVAAIEGGIAGTMVVIFASIATGIESVFSVFTEPLYALAAELASLIAAYIPDELMTAAVQSSASAVDQFGVWAYPIGMIVMAVGLLILSGLLSMEITSNLVPFSTTDWPIIGADEEEEEITED